MIEAVFPPLGVHRFILGQACKHRMLGTPTICLAGQVDEGTLTEYGWLVTDRGREWEVCLSATVSTRHQEPGIAEIRWRMKRDV
jgi:hypothetical protein